MLIKFAGTKCCTWKSQWQSTSVKIFGPIYSLRAKNSDSNGRWGEVPIKGFFYRFKKFLTRNTNLWTNSDKGKKKKIFKNMNINNINTDTKPSSASLLLQHWAQSLQKLTNSKQ